MPESLSELEELGPGGPLVYGSLPYEPGARLRLAALLLKRLGELIPRWRDAATGRISLTFTYLGQPKLLVDGRPGPGVSFSQAGDRLWGAVAARGRVGLELVPRTWRPAEPLSPSPELQEAARLLARLGGDPREAPALLRALGSAALKAIGVGCRYTSPDQLSISAPTLWPGGLRCAVRAGGLVPAFARREGAFWLALALRAGFEDLAR
ncbi:MAG: hypothetical protein WHT07_03330 [Desulfobaccales bacterium]